MKKILSVFLVVFMLLPCAALAAPDTEEVTYKQAEVSANQTVHVTMENDGQCNLLKNGDFETVAATGLPTGWALSGATLGESYMTVAAEDAPSGSNYVRFYGETENVYLAQNITNHIAGKTYIFSAKTRKISGAGSVIVYVTADGQKDGKLQAIERFTKTVAFERNYKGEWIDFTIECPLPKNTERVGFLLRLVGGGEAHYDDVKFVGEATEEVLAGIKFRSMKEADALEDESTNTLQMGGLYSYDKPYTGQNNLIVNGDMEDNDGESFNAWGLQSKFKPFTSVAKGQSYNGSDCVKFNLDAEKDGIHRPFLSQKIPLVGGAEYQVSYWYKIAKGKGVRPFVKMEYQPLENLPGITSAGEKYVSPEAFAYTGEWVHAVVKIYPTTLAGSATVLIRAQQSDAMEEVEVYFDDVEIYMTAPPPSFEIDGGMIFYYPDIEKGTLSTSVNTKFYPELASAKIDYAIMDGAETIWESKGHTSENGMTTVDFPLLLLAVKEKAYRAKATMYNVDGSVHSIATQNVYMYDRPEYLDKNGVFMKEGKTPVYPVIGYHVTRSPENFAKVAAAGINTIQISLNGPQDIQYLDWCEEAGIMGLVTLYPGMKCAGHPDNIDSTIKIINAVKNHPATLGYIVMDEVFQHRPDAASELEDSFRLIRSLDAKHPVCVLEASFSFHEKAGKYVDLLLIDPYSKAQDKRASAGTESARAAVKYEKPVYSILETYHATGGANPGLQTANGGRNNNWQALIAGANGIGYYSINDADSDPVTGAMSVPMWEARDGGALWDALATFGNVEKELAFDHFVFNKTPEFNEYRGDDYWYSSWVDGQNVYMIVLGMKKEGTQEISIPLTSFGGDIQVGEYTATMIAGRNPLETITGSGTLDITLSDVEALFYKITPNSPVDFSKLGATGFEDLGAYPWARQQIGRMDSLDIITGRNDFSYAPAEKITRAEFAGFLIRALGLTSDSTELFADVSADNAFAKEIATGRALGILKGTDGINYNPDAEISRQDLMVICARGMRLVKELADGAPVEGFSDANLIADYAAADIAAMVGAGIIKGNADGTINPLGNTTRAEAAVIMDRCYTWKN